MFPCPFGHCQIRLKPCEKYGFCLSLFSSRGWTPRPVRLMQLPFYVPMTHRNIIGLLDTAAWTFVCALAMRCLRRAMAPSPLPGWLEGRRRYLFDLAGFA